MYKTWIEEYFEKPGNMPTSGWLKEAYDRLNAMPKEAKTIRQTAEKDLFFFARLVNPGYVYGKVHREVYRWMQDYNLYNLGMSVTSNKLIMLPRGHLKSHMVATFVAWLITKHPEITTLYLSATAELAETQLYAIKNILDSSSFRKYWPEYINPEVGQREKWTSNKIIIDHPKREAEAIRDATIATAGLTTNTTGWHADVICADDLVIPENAYTEDGRESVAKKSSQFTSIRNAGGFTIACGTRYHPNDIYATWKQQVTEDYDDDGEYLGKSLIWDIKEYVVEEDNVFLWPRTVRSDGKAFGFDRRVLARIKGEYIDRTQFWAQYYNDPNDPESNRLNRNSFQYINPRMLKKNGSVWSYKGQRLNIYAAIDFAFSLENKADYTAIVVIGVDSDKNIYVVDIDRFKTPKIIDYFSHIAELHSKWQFKKLQAETTVAQATIVDTIKDYIRDKGMRLTIVEYRPSRVEGRKEERIAAILEPRYENGEVWHIEGGWTSVLEEELIQARPAHDDIKDALASAVSIAVAPARKRNADIFIPQHNETASRFGGWQ